MLWSRGWGAGYKCLRKDEKASGNTQSLIARTNLYCDVHISEQPGIQRIKEMDYKDHTTAGIKEQMVKSGGHSLITTENSKDSHRKSLTTSLQITRPQASVVKNTGCKKTDCPSTSQHPMSTHSWDALVEDTSGSQKDSYDQSVIPCIHTASQDQLKDIFLKDSNLKMLTLQLI